MKQSNTCLELTPDCSNYSVKTTVWLQKQSFVQGDASTKLTKRLRESIGDIGGDTWTAKDNTHNDRALGKRKMTAQGEVGKECGQVAFVDQT